MRSFTKGLVEAATAVPVEQLIELGVPATVVIALHCMLTDVPATSADNVKLAFDKEGGNAR